VVSLGIPDTTDVGNILLERVYCGSSYISPQQNNVMTGRNSIPRVIAIETSTAVRRQNALIYNNVLAFCVNIIGTDTITLRNNLIFSGGAAPDTSTHSGDLTGPSTGLSSNYNLVQTGTTTSNWSEGGNSLSVSSGTTVWVAPSSANY